MPDVRFDTYYRYDDLTRILQGYAEESPQFVRLESIGQSYEGRDIWVATVTNLNTGDDQTKPAIRGDSQLVGSTSSFGHERLRSTAGALIRARLPDLCEWHGSPVSDETTDD